MKRVSRNARNSLTVRANQVRWYAQSACAGCIGIRVVTYHRDPMRRQAKPTQRLLVQVCIRFPCHLDGLPASRTGGDRSKQCTGFGHQHTIAPGCVRSGFAM